jgi:hypothetical protein
MAIMPKQRPTSTKRQRERDKQAKAMAKRERRNQAEPDADATAGVVAAREEELDGTEAVLLELIAEAHRQFENAEITFEEYDDRKVALLSRLHVD